MVPARLRPAQPGDKVHKLARALTEGVKALGDPSDTKEFCQNNKSYHCFQIIRGSRALLVICYW